MLDVVFNEGAKGLLEMAKKVGETAGWWRRLTSCWIMETFQNDFPSKERIKSLQMLHLRHGNHSKTGCRSCAGIANHPKRKSSPCMAGAGPARGSLLAFAG